MRCKNVKPKRVSAHVTLAVELPIEAYAYSQPKMSDF